IQDMRSLSGLTKLRELYMGYNLIPTLELADWLPPWQQRVDVYLDFSGSDLWPTLDGPLNGLVRSYKEALRWGRTTDKVGPSRCFSRFPTSEDWDPSKPNFYVWDPSKPPHRVPVRITLVDREESSIDRVVGFLADHCVIVGDSSISRVPSGEQGWNRVYACVHIPLLVPLSELPSVVRVKRPPRSFPASTGGESGDSNAGGQEGCGSDLPGTGVEVSSWGAIKSLFR
ncbi:MAG: hypothetical protein OXG13_05230, partial [Gemmatimonadaceae bacterium]|nr:hypothetical protein [Gemmatimonadaceae bacterium]